MSDRSSPSAASREAVFAELAAAQDGRSVEETRAFVLRLALILLGRASPEEASSAISAARKTPADR